MNKEDNWIGLSFKLNDPKAIVGNTWNINENYQQGQVAGTCYEIYYTSQISIETPNADNVKILQIFIQKQNVDWK